MERREGFLVVMGLVKFHRAMRKQPPEKAPHWLDLHIAVRALEETAERLCNVTRGIEGYADREAEGRKQGNRFTHSDKRNAHVVCCVSEQLRILGEYVSH